MVHESNDIEHWIKFFLIAVGETAKRGQETLEKIIDLRKKYEERIESGMGIKSQKLGKELLKQLFAKPVVSAKEVENILLISKPTAQSLVKRLSELGVLREKTGNSRNRIFVLRVYLDLFNN